MLSFTKRNLRQEQQTLNSLIISAEQLGFKRSKNWSDAWTVECVKRGGLFVQLTTQCMAIVVISNLWSYQTYVVRFNQKLIVFVNSNYSLSKTKIVFPLLTSIIPLSPPFHFQSLPHNRPLPSLPVQPSSLLPSPLHSQSHTPPILQTLYPKMTQQMALLNRHLNFRIHL